MQPESRVTTVVISSDTRDRLYRLKGAGRKNTYEAIIVRALDALEEKMNESPASCSCKSTEPGNHHCNCEKVIV